MAVMETPLAETPQDPTDARATRATLETERHAENQVGKTRLQNINDDLTHWLDYLLLQ